MSFKQTTGKLINSFNELPGWSKGVIAVAGAAGLFLIGKKVYPLIFPSKQDIINKKLTEGIKTDITKWIAAGQVATFEQTNYRTFADQLYEDMRYAVGDNYSGVEAIMGKMENDLDVAYLLDAFGLRQNLFFGLNKGEASNLFSWINNELGQEWGGFTNYRVVAINADWKQKGITYQI